MGGNVLIPHYGIGTFPIKANKGAFVWNDTTGSLAGLYVGDGTLWRQVVLDNFSYKDSGRPGLTIDRGQGLLATNSVNRFQPDILIKGYGDTSAAAPIRIYHASQEVGFGILYNCSKNTAISVTPTGIDTSNTVCSYLALDPFEGPLSGWGFSFDAPVAHIPYDPLNPGSNFIDWNGGSSYGFIQGRGSYVGTEVAAGMNIFAPASGSEIRFYTNRLGADSHPLNNVAISAVKGAVPTLQIRHFTGSPSSGNDYDYGYDATSQFSLNMTTGDLTILGNIKSSQAIVEKTKAGTPSDADFANPQNGMLVVDTSANKIWVRTGVATWKSVAVA